MKKSLIATTAALVFAAGTALASPQTDAIIADLQAMNATNIQVKVGMFRIKAEAYVNGTKIERVYSTDGTLLKEETIVDGVKVEKTFDANGNLISSDMGDDHGGDSLSGHDSDHGDDHGGHDHGNDDHGGDHHGGGHDSGDDHGSDGSHD